MLWLQCPRYLLQGVLITVRASMDWQVVEWLAIRHRAETEISEGVDSHPFSFLNPQPHTCVIVCYVTEPCTILTNNLSHCGMWRQEAEQVLMSHREPQDSEAPAPHISVTIIIIIIIPPFALSFLWCLAVAKTKACYLKSDQLDLALFALLNSHNRPHVGVKSTTGARIPFSDRDTLERILWD